jgi:hypothetical protein
LTAYYAGLYDRYYRPGQLVQSTTIATLVLLAIYAMLPEEMRFSRGIVVFGALLAFCLLSLLRLLLTRLNVLNRPAQDVSKPYLLVAGTQEEFEEIRALLAKKSLDDKIIGRISVNGTHGDSLSALKQWKQAARSLNAKEIIFAAGKLPYTTIIEKVQEIRGRLRIRFFAGHSIIGSDDKTARGKIVSPEADHRLARPGNRRVKRAIDVAVAVFGLVSFPLQFFLTHNPGGFFKNCFLILTGKKTWIGYIQYRPGLPPLRKAVLAPNGLPGKPDLPEASLEMIDYWYAHDYEPWLDLRTIRKAYHHLGG